MLMPLLIVLAIIAGLLRGGTLRNFAALPLRWAPLIIASFVLQLLLFTPFLHQPLVVVVVVLFCVFVFFLWLSCC